MTRIEWMLTIHPINPQPRNGKLYQPFTDNRYFDTGQLLSLWSLRGFVLLQIYLLLLVGVNYESASTHDLRHIQRDQNELKR
jgi:hypothetical protein